jgi:hypothetical protein
VTTIKRISHKNARIIILFDDDDDDNNNNNNNLKTKVVPVIKGTTGTYSKSFRTYLSNLNGKHEIKEIPKKKRTVTLDTAHVLRKVPM